MAADPIEIAADVSRLPLVGEIAAGGPLLAEQNITSFVKTSGSKGLHIFVRLIPEWNGYGVRSAAVALARELERRRPELITAQWWKEDRGERVFVDFNQNAPHKTVFGTWCVRPRVGAQVSCPIPWDEVATVHQGPDDFWPERRVLRRVCAGVVVPEAAATAEIESAEVVTTGGTTA